jgi:hypothetical protein
VVAAVLHGFLYGQPERPILPFPRPRSHSDVPSTAEQQTPR